MICEYSVTDLEELVINQVKNLFSQDINLSGIIDTALDRCEQCFSRVNNKYYFRDGIVYFSPFHSNQYAIFLYYLSNEFYKKNRISEAEKIYLLNKMLNNVELFYEISLPNIWCTDHPLGTVLGRAKFSDYFFFCQGVTVGNNHNLYPTFEENVALFANSMVIGDSHIGRNVAISANTYIVDTDIPDNCIVFGQGNKLKIIHKTEEEMKLYLDQFI